MINTQLKPETLKAIEQQAQANAKKKYGRSLYDSEQILAYESGYADAATSFALKLQQVEQENSNLKDALSSSDTIIDGLEKSCKQKEQENERLRGVLERIATAPVPFNIIEMDSWIDTARTIATEALKQTP